MAVKMEMMVLVTFYAFTTQQCCSFVRSLQAGVQPTLDPSAESSVLAQGEEGSW